MNETEASELASLLADDVSELLSACLPPESESAVRLILNEAGVLLPDAALVLTHFRRLLATPYAPRRPNDFQSKHVVHSPVSIVLSGGARPVALRLWTETREAHPWLSFELVAEGELGLAVGGFRL